MPIYWDLLLETEDVKDALERLYNELPLGAMAEYLGVSRDALRRKLLMESIKLRGRGGSHCRYPRDLLPENVSQMTSVQLASLTGYTKGYSHKLLQQWRRDEAKGDSNGQEKRDSGSSKPNTNRHRSKPT